MTLYTKETPANDRGLIVRIYYTGVIRLEKRFYLFISQVTCGVAQSQKDKCFTFNDKFECFYDSLDYFTVPVPLFFFTNGLMYTH